MSGTVTIRLEMLGGDGLSPQLTLSIRPAGGSNFKNVGQASAKVLNATVDADSEVRLTATFAAPAALAGKAMPVFIQDLKPIPPGPGGPVRYRESGSGVSGRDRNPRFVPTHVTGPKKGPSAIAGFLVDCTFLPITDFVRGFGNFQPFDNTLFRPKETEIRLYSLTRGAPTAWGVGWRPDVFPSFGKEMHTLLLITPTMKKYTEVKDLDSVQLNSLRRFMLSPDPVNPFFIRTFPPQFSDVLHLSEWPSTVTDCGFLQQLSDTGLPVVIASPIPHNGQRAPSLNVKGLMISLRRALHCDEMPKVKELNPGFRTAIASFSKATDDAVTVLQNNRADIDEFYWFEPNQQGALSRKDVVIGWISEGKGRRLRMVGTTRGRDCRDVLKALGPTSASASVFCDLDFRGKAIYKAAVAFPRPDPAGTKAPPFPERFTPVTQAAPPGSLSADTGIFLVSDNGDFNKPSLVLSDKKIQVTIACTHEEAAGKARFDMLNTVKGNPPVKDVVSLANLAANINATVVDGSTGQLHQWAVAGGEDPAMEQTGVPVASRKNFKGFLGKCLEAGVFPS
ncbi:MAG TPA: hypothetical protein VJ385_15045 [Fibrobacteria bacterium]|nr:hypothetical protein [Fibrobacteria bacterium]